MREKQIEELELYTARLNSKAMVWEGRRGEWEVSPAYGDGFNAGCELEFGDEEGDGDEGRKGEDKQDEEGGGVGWRGMREVSGRRMGWRERREMRAARRAFGKVDGKDDMWRMPF